jgi:hypothetical protein
MSSNEYQEIIEQIDNIIYAGEWNVDKELCTSLKEKAYGNNLQLSGLAQGIALASGVEKTCVCPVCRLQILYLMELYDLRASCTSPEDYDEDRDIEIMDRILAVQKELKCCGCP